MYTTAQAAGMIGCSRRQINRWAIRLGLGTMVGPVRSLSPAEVETLRQHIRPGQAGNPEFGAELGRLGGIASGVAKRAKRSRRKRSSGDSLGDSAAS